MQLSIIIPVYNVAEFLPQCLDSVFMQDLTDCEVICVNDGSTDNSGVILRDYKSKYPKMLLIEQNNGGLVAARNAGYADAKGKYIFYLDSDDYLFPNVIKIMLSYVIGNNLDVALFNSDFDTNEKYYIQKEAITKFLTGVDFYREFYKSNGYFPPSVQWLYLYKKQFLDSYNIFFPSDNLQEDEPFTIKAFFHASKVGCLDIPIVFHRVFREGSITQTAKIPHLKDAKIAWERMYNYLKNEECTERIFYHKVFELYISLFKKLLNKAIKKSDKKFITSSDYRIMRTCSINSYWYGYYLFLRHFPAHLNWYETGTSFRFGRKLMNIGISYFYKNRMNHG
jgi:glycosyltransferase involved in cell wall biosynthesis